MGDRKRKSHVARWVVGPAVLGVLVVLAIPNRFGVRCGGGNETSAYATLLCLASAQTQFQAEGHVDLDGDGVGEFGTFSELSSASKLRGRDAPLTPPVVSGVFRTPGAFRTVQRSGYLFRIWLPGRDGRAATEDYPSTPPGEGEDTCVAAPG